MAGCSATQVGGNTANSRSSATSTANASTGGSASSSSSSSSGSSNSGATTNSGDSSIPAGAITFQNIEEMTGWYLSPDQGTPVCSPVPSVTTTPSLDGAAGAFYLGPTGSFNNCLWPIKLGSSQTATHFKLEAYYQLSNPSYPQGVEFSSNKHVGTSWYKFSVQCSYYKGIFSVWDTAGSKWSPTVIPCKRPTQGSWDHLVVNTVISNGKAVFNSLSFNGVSYPINQSFYPVGKPNSYTFGVHFQTDGNRNGDAYEAYVDRLTFSVW